MRNIDSNLIVFLFLLPPSLYIEINIIVILRNLDFSFSLSLYIYICVCIFFFFLSSTSELFDLFSFLFFATIYPRRLERLYTVLLTVIIRNRSELSRDLLILARTPLSKSSSRTFVRRLSKETCRDKETHWFWFRTCYKRGYIPIDLEYFRNEIGNGIISYVSLLTISRNVGYVVCYVIDYDTTSLFVRNVFSGKFENFRNFSLNLYLCLT